MDKEYYKNVEEIWKDISGYIGLYMVSNYGNIKSFINNYGNCRERILKPGLDHGGYLSVCLYKNKNKKYLKVHRLVLEAFVGLCPVGMESYHNDGNPSNNFLDNLRYDTKNNNQRDRKFHGTKANPTWIYKRGSDHPSAKLNNNKIRKIRKLAQEGKLTQKEIGDIFGVKRGAISKIINGITWKHVK